MYWVSTLLYCHVYRCCNRANKKHFEGRQILSMEYKTLTINTGSLLSLPKLQQLGQVYTQSPMQQYAHPVQYMQHPNQLQYIQGQGQPQFIQGQGQPQYIQGQGQGQYNQGQPQYTQGQLQFNQGQGQFNQGVQPQMVYAQQNAPQMVTALNCPTPGK
jgi:hypothetical protein